ncbi:SAV_6107 family HEPN domain-containing protein [Arsenicicoccus piscis]|uniref:SAV-6107-like HEPN domain-containing protein n=1 Tax=Arsenicicoccus piscis TaxID=673954 RepID=A0ABQ6HMS6_9MICO|nr:SAV_6107 family HEPN domain-containing protein [Arsenicicoccus piscis]MCH8628624.1 SAV_6107 family HEPN domain-containing protein [Arsenicicoccus piscis]GMA19447.1 hypothetical protein GCM10025862_14680 [Arsenicicoccus piscis]
MTAPTLAAPLGVATTDLLDRAYVSLVQSCYAPTSAERYVAAHLAALRAGAALLAARSRPERRARPRSVWEVLPQVAPELGEWAAFYTSSARRRAQIEQGGTSPAREADDLLRQSEQFLTLVEGVLAAPPHPALPPLRVTHVEPRQEPRGEVRGDD